MKRDRKATYYAVTKLASNTQPFLVNSAVVAKHGARYRVLKTSDVFADGVFFEPILWVDLKTQVPQISRMEPPSPEQKGKRNSILNAGKRSGELPLLNPRENEHQH